MAIIRYITLHVMMIHEPFSQKLKSYGNIVLNTAYTMQQTMRIDLQNIKENRKKLALTLPHGHIFR